MQMLKQLERQWKLLQAVWHVFLPSFAKTVTNATICIYHFFFVPFKIKIKLSNEAG
jgi:hypothetical protein